MRSSAYSEQEGPSCYEDVFVVTSCTNPADNGSYPNHNLSHSSEQRLVELIETFHSIRLHYPHALIVNVDNSNMCAEQRQQIEANCDVAVNASQLRVMKLARRSPNKGIPYALSASIGASYAARGGYVGDNRLHFLAGRYVLTDAALSTLEEKGTYFFAYPEHRNVSTRYFVSVRENAMKSIFRLLVGVPAMLVARRSVEGTVIGFPFLSWKRVYRLGIRGKVNGEVPIEE